MHYLNFHAPGCDFATYLRGLRDGVKVVYDQEDPPSHGTRPSSEVWIGPPPLELDALTITDRPGGSGTSQRLECCFVLAGERAGTWLEFPPGVPFEAPADERVLRVSARL
jgi:hypothetical protein